MMALPNQMMQRIDTKTGLTSCRFKHNHLRALGAIRILMDYLKFLQLNSMNQTRPTPNPTIMGLSDKVQ
jgi:hypothetical protein